jgi:hypothetical protein
MSPPFQPGQSGNPNGRPTRLTDDQVRLVRQAMAKRRDLQRQLDMLPTWEGLAEQMGVSERYLREIAYDRARLKVVEVA